MQEINNNYGNHQQNFFQIIWGKINNFFVAVEKFSSRNKYNFGLGFGIFVIAGTIIASVFFGPALYTALTGLSAAVIPGLVAITTSLAAAVPFVALVIIAATIVAAFALGLFIVIDSARSLKPQRKLSENQNLLDPNQQTFDQNQQFVDSNQPLLDLNQKKKDKNEKNNS